MLKQGIEIYKRSLVSNPLATKMTTSATLFALGDFICQKTEFSLKKPKKSEQTIAVNTIRKENTNAQRHTFSWDKHRTLVQAALAGFFLSPGLHFFLTRVMVKVALPGYSNATNIALRVFVHQACMMPYIQFTLLFGSGALEPANTLCDHFKAGGERLSSTWVRGCSASLLYWPVVNAVMYSLVKPKLFNLYIDTASMVFASIMSHIMHGDACETVVPEHAQEDNSFSLIRSATKSLGFMSALGQAQ